MTRRARMLRDIGMAGKAGSTVEVVAYPGGMFGPTEADGADSDGDYWCKSDLLGSGVSCIGKPGHGFEWVDEPRKLVKVSTDPDDLAESARRDALNAICERMENNGDVLDLLEMVYAAAEGGPALADLRVRANKLADEVEAEVRRQAEEGL